MNQNLSPLPEIRSYQKFRKVSQPDNQQYFVDNLFSLTIMQKQTRTKIIMDVHTRHINTKAFPIIAELLQEHLPSVFTTTCYNDLGLPFYEEVKNTEIGHLFEHILLEYLCQYKLAKGAKRATYIGRTTWNWLRDPFGRFYIHLTCGKKDKDILPLALEQTVGLTKILLDYHRQPLFATTVPLAAQNGLQNGERGWR